MAAMMVRPVSTISQKKVRSKNTWFLFMDIGICNKIEFFSVNSKNNERSAECLV